MSRRNRRQQRPRKFRGEWLYTTKKRGSPLDLAGRKRYWSSVNWRWQKRSYKNPTGRLFRTRSPTSPEFAFTPRQTRNWTQKGILTRRQAVFEQRYGMTTVYWKQKLPNAPHIQLLLPAPLMNKPYGLEHEEFHACASILIPLTNWLQTLLVVYLVKLRLTSLNEELHKLHCHEISKINACSVVSAISCLVDCSYKSLLWLFHSNTDSPSKGKESQQRTPWIQ